MESKRRGPRKCSRCCCICHLFSLSPQLERGSHFFFKKQTLLCKRECFLYGPSPQNQRTPIPPPQQNDFKTRAHVWEKANLQKIHRRCEKMKSKILSWKTEQKEQAKLHLERKNLMDPTTKAIEQQRYQNKIARIDMIVGTARAQLEDKRRKEESQVRETAKQIRETGRVPIKCFCCFIF